MIRFVLDASVALAWFVDNPVPCAYDAVYFDTTRRTRLPLATLDKRLLAAAQRAKVELYS